MTNLLTSIAGFAAAVLGLTLPGYALARTLRLESCLAAAFPFSAFLLCQAVVLLTCLEWRISFAAVATILIIMSVLFAFIASLRKTSANPETAPSELDSSSDPLLLKISVTAALLLVAAVAFRTTLYPLGGFDTFTRWDALAREMLNHASLSFYPPVTSADFSIYTVPDGFPPLVASVYWWIYASIGSTTPGLTAIAILLQITALLLLTFRAAEYASGRTAAHISLLAITASPLLVSSLQIGQETGYLSLAIAGQLCFTLAAIRRPSLTAVIAAALFAALGAHAREYGPALALPGLLLLLSAPQTRRFAWQYALIAVLLSSPWYIRNWIMTGNPLYPHALPGGFPANNLLTAVLNYYNESLSPTHFSISRWLTICLEFISGAVILIVALPFMVFNFRRFWPYLATTALVTGLWLFSIGSTSGGIEYSMRVLAPAVALLAVICGIAYKHAVLECKSVRLPEIFKAGLLLSALYGLLAALSYPLPPAHIADSIFSTKLEAPEFGASHADMVRQISVLESPPTGILTDSSYFAIMLARQTGFRPVIFWSPEVNFIFDPEISGEDARKKLLAMDIKMVAISKSSVHNDFLFRTPFYRDDFQSWSQLLVAQDSFVLFGLKADQETGTYSKGK